VPIARPVMLARPVSTRPAYRYASAPDETLAHRGRVGKRVVERHVLASVEAQGKRQIALRFRDQPLIVAAVGARVDLIGPGVREATGRSVGRSTTHAGEPSRADAMEASLTEIDEVVLVVIGEELFNDGGAEAATFRRYSTSSGSGRNGEPASSTN
jgi:hypothetical protein